MGCAIVTEAFCILAKLPVAIRLSEIIYGAPDLTLDALQSALPKICQAVTRLTVYTSSNDRALLLSAAINRARPVGLGAHRKFVYRGCDRVDTTTVWHQFYRLGHSYVFGSSRLLADISQTLKGEPQRRYELREVVPPHDWEFVPVRG